MQRRDLETQIHSTPKEVACVDRVVNVNDFSWGIENKIGEIMLQCYNKMNMEDLERIHNSLVLLRGGGGG